MATRLLSEKLASGEIRDINKGAATILEDESVLNRLEVAADVIAKMADGTVPSFFKGGTDPGDALLSKDEIDASIADGAATRMRWMGAWQVNDTYEQFDVVTDGKWLMIANKQTVERPAPLPLGDPKTEFLDPATFVEGSFIGQVISGHDYVFSKPGFLEKIEVYLPEITGSETYEVYIVDRRDELNPVFSSLSVGAPLEGQWHTIAVGSLAVNAGSSISVYIVALNSSSSSQFSGYWNFAQQSNTYFPLAGELSWNLPNTFLRVNETDGNAASRVTELDTVVPGTHIEIRSQNTPTTQITYNVTAILDAGDYREFTVTLVSQTGVMDADEPCDVTFDVPVAGLTKYSEDANHWPTQGQPDYCTVAGYLEEDGVVVAGSENNAYGVRTTFQEYSVSDDWDFMSSAGGGSRGGGVSESMAYFYDKQSAITITQTDPAYQQIASIAYNNAPPGVYEYRISLSHTIDSVVNSSLFRFSIDGGVNWDTFRTEAKDISDVVPLYYAFPKEYASITSLSLIIEAAKTNAGDTMVVTFVDAIIAQVR